MHRIGWVVLDGCDWCFVGSGEVLNTVMESVFCFPGTNSERLEHDGERGEKGCIIFTTTYTEEQAFISFSHFSFS